MPAIDMSPLSNAIATAEPGASVAGMFASLPPPPCTGSIPIRSKRSA